MDAGRWDCSQVGGEERCRRCTYTLGVTPLKTLWSICAEIHDNSVRTWFNRRLDASTARMRLHRWRRGRRTIWLLLSICLSICLSVCRCLPVSVVTVVHTCCLLREYTEECRRVASTDPAFRRRKRKPPMTTIDHQWPPMTTDDR